MHSGESGDREDLATSADSRSATLPTGIPDHVHRIGGGTVENLRLKPAEAKLNPPVISVLKGGSPADAANQMKAAFPNAAKLHEAARTVGSTTEDAIRAVGSDLMHDPTRKFPNHHRIVHRNGNAGFIDEQLVRLSEVFTDLVMGE